MPALRNAVLRARLAAALPSGTRFESGFDEVHPFLATVPGFGSLRAYLWTVTRDRSAPGARPPGEFKIQLILPGQTRRTSGFIDLADRYTVLLGYSPDYGVFVAWEARLYGAFSYSANVQVREPLLSEASRGGWAVDEPRMKRGELEVRVAFTPGNLFHYLNTAKNADHRGLHGKWREAYFLSCVPSVTPPKLPASAKGLEDYIESQRSRIASVRLYRDATFSPRVKREYAYACAVCGLQLEIVEAAHIIPVHEKGSPDKIWNGMAMCPNHHKLFDSRSFLVRPDLQIQVDKETVEFLEQCKQSAGLNHLTYYDSQLIRPPNFWTRETDFREKMRQALERRMSLAGHPTT